MSGDFDLDHVGIAAADLDRLEAAYRRLGFTLTERSWHMTTAPDGGRQRAGTGNHCIILRRGYVELIAPTEPGYAGRLLADLARYEGLHLISLGTKDQAMAVTAMSEAAGAPVVARRVTRPFEERGRSFEAVFDILDLPAGTLDDAHIFGIEHLTPDAIWQPELMAHANGAVDLRGVTLCVDDPERRAARLAPLFGAALAGTSVRLRAGAIDYEDATGFAARFPEADLPARPFVGSVTLGVADLAHTAAFLASAGVSFHRADGRLWTGAPEGCGAIVEFVS